MPPFVDVFHGKSNCCNSVCVNNSFAKCIQHPDNAAVLVQHWQYHVSLCAPLPHGLAGLYRQDIEVLLCCAAEPEVSVIFRWSGMACLIN